MVYVGVLPYAIDDQNQLWFLLGKEHPEEGWNDAERWAHFAGGSESSDKSMLKGSAREAYEESMGFLGSLKEIETKLSENAVVKIPGILVYLMEIPYDSKLPALYKNVYEYCMKASRPHPYKIGYQYIPTAPDGFFEKTEIRWFSEAELKKQEKGIFRRSFDQIIKETFKQFQFI